MIVKLLTEHHLEFLSLKGGCTGSSESTLVKMPHCWKSHATARIMHIFKTLAASLCSLAGWFELCLIVNPDFPMTRSHLI